MPISSYASRYIKVGRPYNGQNIQRLLPADERLQTTAQSVQQNTFINRPRKRLIPGTSNRGSFLMTGYTYCAPGPIKPKKTIANNIVLIYIRIMTSARTIEIDTADFRLRLNQPYWFLSKHKLWATIMTISILIAYTIYAHPDFIVYPSTKTW